MNGTAADGRTRPAAASPDELKRLDRLAWLLDNSIPLPGTSYRVGLDGVIGLIPGVGDAVGALISSYVVGSAARSGAPISLLARMGLNVLVEAVVGVIPFFGDLFDFGFKANARNVRLYRRHLDSPGGSRRASRAVVAVAVLVILTLLAVLGLVAIAVLRWAWTTATGGA